MKRTKIDRFPNFRESSIATYGVGLVFSLALTIAAFVLVNAQRSVQDGLFSSAVIVGLLAGFAVLQLVVQILFFLHLTFQGRVRWNAYAAIFVSVLTLIIVVGSVWIMRNLDYHMMPKNQTQYMHHEENIR